MLTVILGLSGTLIFGSGDFYGGLAAKRIGAFLATGVAALLGIFLLLAYSLFIPGKISFEAMLWGGLSGLCGGIAILLLYAALAIGPMSILSPLGALISAVIPVIWALFVNGESLLWYGYLALFVGGIAIVFVAFTPEKTAIKPNARGIIYASISGVLIGLFLIVLDRAPSDAGLYPLVFNRIVNVTIMFSAVVIIALVRYTQRRGFSEGAHQTQISHNTNAISSIDYKVGIKFALICGVLDATGNALLLLGIQIGNLAVMSVLTAMYPAGTIILAAIVLREKITKLQLFGMILALAAAGLLAVS